MVNASPRALRVLDARYLRRDAKRRVIETPSELFDRVGLAVSEAELLLETAREADRGEEVFRASSRSEVMGDGTVSR